MAIVDGDPRTFAPALFEQLSWLEKKWALRAYGERHTMTGPKYPADEAPVSIARRAFVVGATAGRPAYVLLPIVLVSFVNVAGGGFIPVPLGLTVLAGLTIVAGLLGWLRVRWVNRYFAERFPTSGLPPAHRSSTPGACSRGSRRRCARPRRRTAP